jgi:hypothetical protein
VIYAILYSVLKIYIYEIESSKTEKVRESLHLFRRSNSRDLFFLRRETDSKEKGKKIDFFFMNVEIASNFEAI